MVTINHYYYTHIILRSQNLIDLGVHPLFVHPLDKTHGSNHNGIEKEPSKGAAMYSITVKNIPEDIYKRLKHQAKSNRRSINSEIILIIEEAVESKKIEPEEFLVRAYRLREKTADYMITDDEFTQAKESGRQ